MHKFKYALCAIGIASCFGANAATDGKVSFNGELTDETCQVKDNSKDIVVNLPKISTATLATTGDEAGTTAFKIEVEKCPVSVKKVTAHFEAVKNSGYDPSTGNLRNDSTATGSATNVQVRLYNLDDNSQVTIGGTGHSYPVNADSKQATMYFAGGYYATGQTTPGAVTANVQYVLAYP
ncbi:F17 fimbrial protein [Izhakiella australiensis]|uniref:F17 fimbrial protein n=1 Tax=Izhakiella australiensis TaxID=1926881 RepID=A0A1S8YM43_9GAMM|nr:fimbrial protein [Izhakiella australiensis]OON40191.1 F17 fimbrial protein [Izhakiella australiensis]